MSRGVTLVQKVGYRFRKGPDAKGGKWGGNISLLIRLWGLGECRELSKRGPGRWTEPGRKWFYCNLISADQLF